MIPKVKICGITGLDDALCAVEAGADALGFVFWGPSPRCVEPDAIRLLGEMIPPLVWRVGVFVDATAEEVETIVAEARLDAVQLHGEETAGLCSRLQHRCRVFKAFRMRDESVLARMRDYEVDALLLDAFVEEAPGGTGCTFRWDWAARARELGRPIILAGGLTAANVQEAIRRVQPYAVDVSSGVESSPGKKDPEKLRAFLAAVKGVG